MCPAPTPTDDRARTLRPALVAVGLGSNLGDRREALQLAVNELKDYVDDFRISAVYETEPLHVVEQPRFLNACCTGRSVLPPRPLLQRLHLIERRAGRERRTRFGPRTLDLDLLLYGDEVIDEPGLRVPHPRMHERAFVLVPLLDILPDWTHPALRRTVAELAASVSRDGVRLFEPHMNSRASASDESGGVHP